MKTVNETQGNRCEVDLLKERLEAQKSSLEKVEMQNVNLTQRLHETLEEMKCIAKERAELWSVKERLTGERDQLKKSLEETVTKVSTIYLAWCNLNVLKTTGIQGGQEWRIVPEEFGCRILQCAHSYTCAEIVLDIHCALAVPDKMSIAYLHHGPLCLLDTTIDLTDRRALSWGR